LIGIDDGAAVHFRNEAIVGYLSSRKTSAAYVLQLDSQTLQPDNITLTHISFSP